MSNHTKWVTCRWYIDLKKIQLSGALGNTYVSSNYGCYNHNISNSHDDDFIEASLGGWAIVVGCTKRQFQIANLLKVDYKPNFL